MPRETAEYVKLSPRLMVQLAAPHSWAASIFPVLLALSFAAVYLSERGAQVSPVMVCVLLAISILMQSAVNTINDYFDYVKGTDTVDNQPDPTDAVLVYNKVNPQDVKHFAFALLALAFLLGIYCIVKTGIAPLIIALIGVAIIYLYSGGRTPISYLPIGEVVSGFTMGGLITLASYCCLTGILEWRVLIWSIPLMLGIGLIMMTNNGCDIEKDIPAGRKTLPVLLGHTNTLRVYHGIIYTWVVAICLIVAIWFTKGWLVLPFMLLAVHPLARALLANPLTPASRAQAFSQCTSLNMVLGAFFSAAVFASLV